LMLPFVSVALGRSATATSRLSCDGELAFDIGWNIGFCIYSVNTDLLLRTIAPVGRA
jgi:hypothetical protein